MIPVLTPVQLRLVDERAPVPVEQLIDRAGAAVARHAIEVLGGTYGRRVAVLVGPGNNGADGLVAARRLERSGVSVQVHRLGALPDRIRHVDLVIDAVFGTGLSRPWSPPDVGGIDVLAVDTCSGIDGLTGAVLGGAFAAVRTVTFVALKPGLLFEPGRSLSGDVRVVDIGLDPASGGSRCWRVERDDAERWIPSRRVDTHKWASAVWLVAGSPGMSGAAWLAARGAQRAGAGMVRAGSPGSDQPDLPREVVGRTLPTRGWAEMVLADGARVHAMVAGPGLGRGDDVATGIGELVRSATVPLVLDADGLWAAAWNPSGPIDLLRRRPGPTVLTPHDGEYAIITGRRPGADRIEAARSLASDSGAVVLLKGPATVVADPDGTALVIDAGDERLATAGTGDVLAGMIGALLARGVVPLHAAAAAAWWHGAASRLGPVGLVAGDLPDLLPRVWHGR